MLTARLELMELQGREAQAHLEPAAHTLQQVLAVVELATVELEELVVQHSLCLLL